MKKGTSAFCHPLLQTKVVQRIDNAIHQINHYTVDSAVCFADTHQLNSDLSCGRHYPPFEQLGQVL